MRNIAIVIAPIALTALIAACSGATADVGSGGDAGADGEGGATQDAAPTVTADQAAGDAASALCARYAACAPLYITLYGGQSTCASRLKQALIVGLGASGTSTTPTQIETCAQALPAVSCADLLSRNTPNICHATPGTLADGAICSGDGQCTGTRCKVAKNGTCGVCGALAGSGGTCAVDDDCTPGLTCAANQVCVKYGAPMDACDTNHPCRADLACTGGTCNARKAAGQTCGPNVDDCDNLNSVICNPQVTTCQTITFAATGAMCGIVAGSFVACAGPGAMCQGITAPTYQGTCIAGAADGAACDDTNGPKCMPPAVCNSGTCKLADPAACK